MAINREKTVLVLALLIFIAWMATFLKGRLDPAVSYSDLPVHELNDSRQEVLRMEPRTFAPEPGTARDPFRYSSGWKSVKPEFLPPPRVFDERRPRAPFGWLAERGVGASLRYQNTTPVPLGDKKDDEKNGKKYDGSSAHGLSDEATNFQRGGRR